MVDEKSVQDNGGQPGAPSDQKHIGKPKSRAKKNVDVVTVKRRCVSSACVACRKRKSKCDGNTPSCAACSSVYHTPCVYDPNSDHRRKGVYKQDIDNLRNRNTTLQTLVQAILNYDEKDVPELVRQIRSCEDLEEVAESIIAREKTPENIEVSRMSDDGNSSSSEIPQFESELSGKMSELMLDGSVRVVGGTSNLIFLPSESDVDSPYSPHDEDLDQLPQDSITCWTRVTRNKELIRHLLTMYFTWHYAYFTTLSKRLFYRDFIRGRPSQHCSSLLVNSMLALGCHFTSWPAARQDPDNSSTAGDHFFKEAKRLILENDEHEKAKLCNVQAYAIMSVREAGCGREGSGWVYSGMSFRMAYDLGLNVDATGLVANSLNDEDLDARRITFWGCYLFDKCWSNYLGRTPQLSGSNITIPKFDVFPEEDAEMWSPYTDTGVSYEHRQPSRTRAVALHISYLCEISGDLLHSFYSPTPAEKHIGKQEELKRLSQLHTRLEAWRKNLPKEMEPKDGQLPQVLLMHTFFQLLFIHLYRPFLKYTKSTSPLPSHVSPRKLCTQAAASISKLFRMYKRSYGLRQICNVAVYIVHSACTIHLLNLPDKTAKRDIVHGLKNLEEMADCWPCARRTLRILDISARKWNIELPNEAIAILERTHAKFGSWGTWDQGQSPPNSEDSPMSRSFPIASAAPTGYSTPDRTMISTGFSKSQIATVPSPPNSNFSHYQNYASLLSSRATRRPSLTGMQPMRPTTSVPSQPAMQAPHGPNNTQVKPENWIRPQVASHAMSTGSDNPNAIATPQIPFPFNSVENNTDQSQEWWLRDQNALAFGLDNWPDSWDATTATVSGGGGSGTMDFEHHIPAGNTPASGISNDGQVFGSESQDLASSTHLSGAGSSLGISMPVALPAGYETDYLVEGKVSSQLPSTDEIEGLSLDEQRWWKS